MRKNIALMRRVLEHIETHPETWDQKFWRCGSAMCFAGHAAFFAGAEWAHPEFDNLDASYDRYDDVITPDGRIMHVSDFASEMLGLNRKLLPGAWVWSDEMFDAENSLGDLKRLVAYYEAAELENADV
jgi:hypothetical protein